MRILAVNKFYHIRGGSDRYFFELARLQEGKGHQVIPFSMHHERNRSTPYAPFFVSRIEFFEDGRALHSLRAALRVLYSWEAGQNICRLVEATKPEIAHLHIICHQISPSILPSLKRYGLPVVQTLHEYKRICPTYSLVAHGRICERCKGHRYYQAVLQRCNRGSLAASLLNCLEMYLHKSLHIYEKNIDLFITPSDFMRRKMIEFGMAGRKIVHIPNFIQASRYQPSYRYGGYFLYVGRLIEIKGLFTLLKAMKRIRGSKLYIVGEGELRPQLERYAIRAGMENIRFLGYRSGEELNSLIRNSMFTVLPSEWYENFPMAIMESLALGKPVIGARIGGIPELIEEGVDGLLFQPGEVEDLTVKINRLLEKKHLLAEMGKAGRDKIERKYGAEEHYRHMMELYSRVLV